MRLFTFQEDGVEDCGQPDTSHGEHLLDHLVVANLAEILGRIEFHNRVPRVPVRRPGVGAVDGVDLLGPREGARGKVLILVEDLSRSECGKLGGLVVETFYGRVHNLCQKLGSADDGSGKSTLDPLQGGVPPARRIVRIRITGGRAFEPFVGRGIPPPSPDALGDDESDVRIKDGTDEGRFELSTVDGQRCLTRAPRTYLCVGRV